MRVRRVGLLVALTASFILGPVVNAVATAGMCPAGTNWDVVHRVCH